MTKSLLRADQIAELLNVRVSTIYEWAHMHYIPHIRLETGKKKPCLRFRRSSVEEWLLAKEKQGRATRLP